MARLLLDLLILQESRRRRHRRSSACHLVELEDLVEGKVLCPSNHDKTPTMSAKRGLVCGASSTRRRATPVKTSVRIVRISKLGPGSLAVCVLA